MGLKNIHITTQYDIDRELEQISEELNTLIPGSPEHEELWERYVELKLDI